MTKINRPFFNSFEFQTVQYSDTKLDQLHKLIRNFIASLDLGCPNVKHVDIVGYDVSLAGMDGRQRYLAWVYAWKQIYRHLSLVIRAHKTYRKTVTFPKLNAHQEEIWFRVNPGNNLTAGEHLRGLSDKHLERLQESAQAMLNARYNAKLGAAERRRRAIGLKIVPAEPVVLEV